MTKNTPYVKEWNKSTKELLNPITKEKPFFNNPKYAENVGSKYHRVHRRFMQKSRLSKLEWMREYSR